jgi:hypothetical protein
MPWPAPVISAVTGEPLSVHPDLSRQPITEKLRLASSNAIAARMMPAPVMTTSDLSISGG